MALISARASRDRNGALRKLFDHASLPQLVSCEPFKTADAHHQFSNEIVETKLRVHTR